MTNQTLRVAVGQIGELTDEKLIFAAQIGVTGLHLNALHMGWDAHWTAESLKGLVQKAAGYGLEIEAIENVPFHWYGDIMLGGPERDTQIATYQDIIRNFGAAGIPILGHHFMPSIVWRTEIKSVGRAGTLGSRFDASKVDGINDPELLREFIWAIDDLKNRVPIGTDDQPIITRDELWANYERFLSAVLPVAEASGVRLALHPDDPPEPTLGGIPRLFYEPAGFKRAFEQFGSSPSWGLNLCLGCCSEMPGGFANVKEMIEFFGPKGKIFYCHFRDVDGSLPNFIECFLGDGNYNPAEVMILLKRNGFTGFMIDDHVPEMNGDSPWQHRARANAIGYLQGMLKMSDYLDTPAMR